jgi:hypothetical protein
VADGLSFVADSDVGPALDEQAKREYGRRLRELREEIEEAEAFNDPERLASSREEYAAIAEQIAAATGLGGRDRRVGSTAERARLNVTRAVKSAIARIAESDRPLGDHLAACVQTGRVCVYRPAGDVTWRVAARGGAGAAPARSDAGEQDEPAPAFSGGRLPLPPRLADEARHMFVGRKEPLAWLSERFEQARSGQAQLELVSGEAGIGKTNLVAQLAKRAHEEETIVLYGSCEVEALVPFQPWVQALDGYTSGCPLELLREQATASGGELARLLPALRRRLPELPAPATGDAIAERYWLFEAVREFLTRIAQAHPLLVVLDDLHWADTTTVLLLKHLARARIQAPLLIVATYRETEVASEHPLVEAVPTLCREGLADRLRLDGMNEVEVAEMIAAWTGEEVADVVVQELRNRTEGHPFFLQEMLRSLRESGALADAEDGARRLSSLPSAGVPESVREVLAGRLRRLNPSTLRVLSVAAVIGREFDVDVLAEVSELAEVELFELLEQAASTQLIVEASGLATSYMFWHALVRETLYDELTGPHRARLHERIARAYEAGDDAARERHLSELAHHYFQAGTSGEVLRKAADYAERAGDHAASQLAYEEAAVHYEHAVRALASADGDPSRRCRLLLAQGESLTHSGEFKRAEATCQEAAELAEALGLAEELARAALGVIGQLGSNRGATRHNPPLVVLMERALAQLPDEDSPLRARLMARVAEAIVWSRDEEARSLATASVEMARRVADAATLAEVLSASQQASRGPDTIATDLETVRECERLARASGSTTALVESYWWQMAALAELGELEQARAVAEKMTPLAEELRQPYYSWMDALPKAMFAFLEKPVDEIEPLIWRAGELGHQLESRVSRAFLAIQLTELRMIEGRYDELQTATDALTVPGSPELPGWRGTVWSAGLAVVRCRLGLDAEARSEFEQLAVDDFTQFPRDYTWLTGMEYLTELCAHLADARRAAILYDQLLPYADRYVVIGHFGVPRGSVHRLLAALAAICEKRDRAAEHFENALAHDEATGSAYAVAKCKYDYALTLLDRQAPGDRDRAEELLRDAQATATRLRMGALETKLRELGHDGLT